MGKGPQVSQSSGASKSSGGGGGAASVKNDVAKNVSQNTPHAPQPSQSASKSSGGKVI